MPDYELGEETKVKVILYGKSSAFRWETKGYLKQKISQYSSSEKLDNKVRYLLGKLREEKRIVNIGSDKQPKWIIDNNEEK